MMRPHGLPHQRSLRSRKSVGQPSQRNEHLRRSVAATMRPHGPPLWQNFRSWRRVAATILRPRLLSWPRWCWLKSDRRHEAAAQAALLADAALADERHHPQTAEDWSLADAGRHDTATVCAMISPASPDRVPAAIWRIQAACDTLAAPLDALISKFAALAVDTALPTKPLPVPTATLTPSPRPRLLFSLGSGCDAGSNTY